MIPWGGKYEDKEVAGMRCAGQWWRRRGVWWWKRVGRKVGAGGSKRSYDDMRNQ